MFIRLLGWLLFLDDLLADSDLLNGRLLAVSGLLGDARGLLPSGTIRVDAFLKGSEGHDGGVAQLA